MELKERERSQKHKKNREKATIRIAKVDSVRRRIE